MKLGGESEVVDLGFFGVVLMLKAPYTNTTSLSSISSSAVSCQL